MSSAPRLSLLAGLLLGVTSLSGCLLGEEQVDCQASFALCPEGFDFVESCVASDDCIVREACGEASYCQRIGSSCDASPECSSDEAEVGRCADDSNCAVGCLGQTSCREVSLCGETVFCVARGQCDGIPVCAEGFVEVETCPQDVSCERITICGQTILCAEDASCDAGVSCPPNSVEVEGCRDNGARCTKVDSCGQTIYCEEVGNQCNAYPSCPAEAVEVEECPADAYCFPQSLCGHTILCQLVGSCPELPVCPPGGQQVQACPPNGAVECEEHPFCGMSITCAFRLGCKPQEAQGVGDCDAALGYAWSGAECVPLSGCECVGADCAQRYASAEDCKEKHQQCF